MDCKYCKNKFSNKNILKNHQATAKYCLKIQNNSVGKLFFNCTDCNKNFSSSYNLNRHIEKCYVKTANYKGFIENLEKENKELNNRLKELIHNTQLLKSEHKQEIQILQDKLENIAIKVGQRPTTTTYNNRTQINNIIEKMDIITDNHLKDQIPNLTIEHLKQGVKGYVEYAMKYPLKNKVLCVDYARRKIKYKDENGEIITDPEMSTLSQKFFDSIADKNKALAMEVVSQLPDDLDPENKMKIVCDMAELMSSVNQSVIGNKTDFTHDFVRGVCSKTVC